MDGAIILSSDGEEFWNNAHLVPQPSPLKQGWALGGRTGETNWCLVAAISALNVITCTGVLKICLR